MFYILAYLGFLSLGIMCFILAVKFWLDEQRIAGVGFALLGIVVLFPLWFPLLASLGERPSDGAALPQARQNDTRFL